MRNHTVERAPTVPYTQVGSSGISKISEAFFPSGVSEAFFPSGVGEFLADFCSEGNTLIRPLSGHNTFLSAVYYILSSSFLHDLPQK